VEAPDVQPDPARQDAPSVDLPDGAQCARNGSANHAGTSTVTTPSSISRRPASTPSTLDNGRDSLVIGTDTTGGPPTAEVGRRAGGDGPRVGPRARRNRSRVARTDGVPQLVSHVAGGLPATGHEAPDGAHNGTPMRSSPTSAPPRSA
jgi:hypothetical protein